MQSRLYPGYGHWAWGTGVPLGTSGSAHHNLFWLHKAECQAVVLRFLII